MSSRAARQGAPGPAPAGAARTRRITRPAGPAEQAGARPSHRTRPSRRRTTRPAEPPTPEATEPPTHRCASSGTPTRRAAGLLGGVGSGNLEQLKITPWPPLAPAPDLWRRRPGAPLPGAVHGSQVTVSRRGVRRDRVSWQRTPRSGSARAAPDSQTVPPEEPPEAADPSRRPWLCAPELRRRHDRQGVRRGPAYLHASLGAARHGAWDRPNRARSDEPPAVAWRLLLRKAPLRSYVCSRRRAAGAAGADGEAAKD